MEHDDISPTIICDYASVHYERTHQHIYSGYKKYLYIPIYIFVIKRFF